jgi:hypothetical protein
MSNLSISRPRCVWSCVWFLVCTLMTCSPDLSTDVQQFDINQ